MTSNPSPRIKTLWDGSYLITVNGRRSIVSSAHLIEERIAQLSRPGWGYPDRQGQGPPQGGIDSSQDLPAS